MAQTHKSSSPETIENVVFLIAEALTRENREIIALKFSSELERLGYSRKYISLLLNRDRHLGNDAIVRLIVNCPEAREFIISLLKEQIAKLEEAMKIVETADLEQLKDVYGPKVDEDEEEE